MLNKFSLSTTPAKIPFYIRIAFIAVGLFVFVYTMYIAQHIIVPLIFGIVLAILLNPFVNYLMSKRVNKVVAISIAVSLAILVVFFVLYIISSQVTMFSETYPRLKSKFAASSTELIAWVSEKFNIKASKINSWTKETQTEAIENFNLGERLTEAGSFVITMFLLPVNLFMILYYKPLLVEFIRRLFGEEHKVVVTEVLCKTKTIIQSYLVGLFFEMVIIAILSSVALLILGIDYAIVLGITGAILNIIPYIGGIIAIALPMIIAYATKDSPTYAVLVFVTYITIQFIDNHYIIPKIVGAKVKLNALVSVLVILIGSAIWGVPGMFLSIPITAIFKVIFDHIEPLKPWGFLLGNIEPVKVSRIPFVKVKA